MQKIRTHHLEPSCRFLLAAVMLTAATLSLSGCTANIILQPVQQSVSISGTVHGGSLPVSGATIQLYAAGTGGDGTAATPLITSTVTSASDGSFSLKGTVNCPVTNPLVYIVATGGNPGLPSGTNPQLAMLTAIGPCLSIGPSTQIAINEVTTVGSIAALYPYFSNSASSSYSTLASSAADSAQLTAAFGNVSGYVNTATGTAVGSSNVTSTLNSLANSMTSCVNSPGGSAGDTTLCGNFLLAATDLNSINGAVPTDTASAVIYILQHPFLNASTIYYETSTTPPFSPALVSPPTSWSLPLGTPPTLTPAGGTTLSKASSITYTVTIADTDPTVTIYYYLNRGGLNSAPQPYTGPINVTLNSAVTQTSVFAYAVSSTGAISSTTVGNYTYVFQCTSLCT